MWNSQKSVHLKNATEICQLIISNFAKRFRQINRFKAFQRRNYHSIDHKSIGHGIVFLWGCIQIVCNIEIRCLSMPMSKSLWHLIWSYVIQISSFFVFYISVWSMSSRVILPKFYIERFFLSSMFQPMMRKHPQIKIRNEMLNVPWFILGVLHVFLIFFVCLLLPLMCRNCNMSSF